MNREAIELILKQNGGRITKSRRHMIDLFVGNPNRHYTIEELINELSLLGEKNVATVYNNLSTFVDNKIVYEFTFNNKKHYELAQGIHAHFVCLKCSSVTNIEIPGLTCIAIEIEKKTGNVVTSNNIEFFGCCKKCQDDNNCVDCKEVNECQLDQKNKKNNESSENG